MRNVNKETKSKNVHVHFIFVCILGLCIGSYVQKLTKKKKKTKEIKYGNTGKINASECNRQIWKI